jgi:glucosylceramidase
MRRTSPLGIAVTVVAVTLAAQVLTAAGGASAATVRFAVRVHAGGGAYRNSAGRVFQADSGFTGGYTNSRQVSVAGTADPELYRTERWGMTAWQTDVPRPGTYTVRLHFAETYWTARGQRVLSVTAQGKPVVTALDLVARVGANRAYVVQTAVNVTGGQLVLGFSATVDNPKIDAIEVLGGATSPPSPPGSSVHEWLTTADQAHLLERQPDLQRQPGSGAATVSIDPSQQFQTMDGFGAAVTESSAYLLNHVLTAAQRAATLQDLFDPASGAGLSYVRVPIGSSDFALSNYTADDMPAGSTDPTLAHFSIARDLVDIIPVVKAARAVNPRLSVMVSPWSAPAWMKTSRSLIGGTLDPAYFGSYAQYLVRVVQAYAAQGVRIDTMTVQNEPGFSPAGYPGMLLSVDDEIRFVRDSLGPAFAAAHLTTEILGFDHNWDTAARAQTLLSDAGARQFLAGTAYHCYGGDPSAQTPVHDAYPDKGIYFTECSGGDWSPLFANNLSWINHTLMINSVRNWSKTVLLWNLALDQNDGPTNGGCADCRGVITVDQRNHAVTRNVEFYALAHTSKFLVPGAARIASSTSGSGGVESVAYRNPDGGFVLLLLNSAQTPQQVTLDTGKGWATTSLAAGSVATLTWS